MARITCEGSAVLARIRDCGEGYWYLASPYSRMPLTEA